MSLPIKKEKKTKYIGDIKKRYTIANNAIGNCIKKCAGISEKTNIRIFSAFLFLPKDYDELKDLKTPKIVHPSMIIYESHEGILKEFETLKTKGDFCMFGGSGELYNHLVDQKDGNASIFKKLVDDECLKHSKPSLNVNEGCEEKKEIQDYNSDKSNESETVNSMNDDYDEHEDENDNSQANEKENEYQNSKYFLRKY